MKRQRYTTEFKREAARLLIMDGLSAPEVAAKLGVNRGLLYRWKSEHLAELDTSSGAKAGSSPTEMAAEIEQLRQRLAKAERINEILKKTVSYFAKDE
uniref:transposase n=1 Tax=Cephaloticoccus sp. TaxID=1985742 RepID=UPI00404B8429